MAQNNDAEQITFKSEFKYKYADVSIIPNDSSNINSHVEMEKINLGIQAGFHSPDLSKNSSSDFNRGLYLELYLGYNLSNEVLALIAFNYWEAQTDQISSPSTQIPSKTVTSKALKFELDFSLFKIYSASILFGPSLSIENINTANGTVFSLGANLKFKLPLPVLNERAKLLAAINYQYGAESLNIGGGMHYSFFSYLFGVEIGI